MDDTSQNLQKMGETLQGGRAIKELQNGDVCLILIGCFFCAFFCHHFPKNLIKVFQVELARDSVVLGLGGWKEACRLHPVWAEDAGKEDSPSGGEQSWGQ